VLLYLQQAETPKEDDDYNQEYREEKA